VLPLKEAMTKHADSATRQRTRWLRALRIAHILFEEDGYHTAYLSEIEAFLSLHPPLTAQRATPPAPHTEDLW
jgi:hypothetical protein